MKRFLAFALLGLFAFVGCNADQNAAPENPDAGVTAPADVDAAAPVDADAAAPADADADAGVEVDAEGTAPIDAAPANP